MIAVDIGNTNIHFARIKNDKIIKSSFISTSKINKDNLKEVLRPYRKDKILVCSVVPAVTKLFKELKKTYAEKIYIVGQDLIVPIKSQYDKNNIGMDRLVCAFASKTINSAARLVIDFGTAITFDFISAEGEYQGGFILPGIGSTLRVLSSCALLPKKISFKKSRKKIEGEKKIQIPKDTKSSIKQGIEDGFSAMVNSLVKKYSQDLNFGAEDKIFTTGGDFYVIKHYLTFKYIFDSSLVMKGLIFLNKKCL